MTSPISAMRAPVIVFDVLFRAAAPSLRRRSRTYVRNITDVDDKINARAARDYPGVPLNEAIRKVTEQTDSNIRTTSTALGCLAPTVQPRATEHIAGDARDHREAGGAAALPMSPKTTCCSRRRR